MLPHTSRRQCSGDTIQGLTEAGGGSVSNINRMTNSYTMSGDLTVTGRPTSLHYLY